jgi:hypothetical protein
MSKKTLNESQILRFKMLSGVDTLAEEKMREMEYSDDKMEEAAKPDFIDIDKDGDKEESMKKAAADKKKGKKGKSDDEEKMDEAMHEDEDTMEEGGAAARTGNEDRDVGRERMHADRVHENLIRKVVKNVTKRVVKESKKINRLAHREQAIRQLEENLIRRIESKRAAANREALIEATIQRVVGRLKESK